MLDLRAHRCWLVVLVMAGCGSPGAPALSPFTVTEGQVGATAFAIEGQAPEAYLTTEDGQLLLAADYAATIGGVPTTVVSADGTGVTVHVASELVPGTYPLELTARGEHWRVEDALEVTPLGGAGLYTVGGTVAQLTGSGLVLQNNGGDDLPRSSSGPFTFTTVLATGQAYEVRVATNPTGQVCAIGNGTGVVAAAPITDVMVTCVTPSGVGVLCDPEGPVHCSSAEVCCFGTTSGTCSSGSTCTSGTMRCSDSAGCGGGICCARIKKSDDKFVESLCTTSTATCDDEANSQKRVEYWCDPGAASPCPGSLTCVPATIAGYFQCE